MDLKNFMKNSIFLLAYFIFMPFSLASSEKEDLFFLQEQPNLPYDRSPCINKEMKNMDRLECDRANTKRYLEEWNTLNDQWQKRVNKPVIIEGTEDYYDDEKVTIRLTKDLYNNNDDFLSFILSVKLKPDQTFIIRPKPAVLKVFDNHGNEYKVKHGFDNYFVKNIRPGEEAHFKILIEKPIPLADEIILNIPKAVFGFPRSLKFKIDV